jgi:hypothetical protein
MTRRGVYRLAKDLYEHCFDVIHGTSSAFEFSSGVNA